MPTGYTHGVSDGTITDFTEYALQCARNFGACIMLRDEPLSSEIPEFEPSDYSAKALASAERQLAEFDAMNESQRHDAYAAEQAENMRQAEEGIARNQQTKERYEAMLAKARAFVSPSPDHDNYANFLVDQLTQSIEWACCNDYWEQIKQSPPFAVWQKKKREGLLHDIEYHTKANAEEIERTAKRNEWVRQLKRALGITTLKSH